MTSQTHRECGDRRRDGSDVTTSQGWPVAPRVGTERHEIIDVPPEPLEGVPPFQSLDLELQASSTEREDICDLSLQVCGNLLKQP